MRSSQHLITERDFDRLNHMVHTARAPGSGRAYLQALGSELKRSRVVPLKRVPKGVVTMHSQVRLRDMGSDEVETYTLVYPEEADIDQGKLSVLAPLGTAILGTRAGETVTWQVPAGWRTVRIEKILYQPEAAGDLHL